MAGKLNPKLQPSDNVDLDQLFNFLGEVPDSVRSESVRSVASSNETTNREASILDEIDRQMSDLQNEIDRYSLRSQTDQDFDRRDEDDDVTPPPPPEYSSGSSPPPLPPPLGTTPPASSMMLAKPSLPEPEGPPPPPPVQNGYAFNANSRVAQETRQPQEKPRSKEPIYESIKPRPDPVGGPSGPPEEYGFSQLESAPAGRRALPQTPNEEQPAVPNAAVQAEREARRLVRVKRELERIQELNEEEGDEETPAASELHDMLEFAENYFNDHEKSPSGTIVGTLKHRSKVEMLTKAEMITYYKGSSIPNSHIHLFDPENVGIACNIFKDLSRFSKGSEGSEVGIIQSIIKSGLQREELRDEIYVQCVRQITNNPHREQVDRLWLMLCLVVVAFPPGKSFFRYFVSFLRRHQNDPEPGRQYVEWCLDNCNHVHAVRKNPPSTVEITAMKRLGTIVCRFFFLDGRTKALDVHPCDTAQDVLQKLADKIGLQSLDGWALYQTMAAGKSKDEGEPSPEKETHIGQHCFLYDVISEWELHPTSEASSGKSKKSGGKNPPPGGDNRFVMKKRLFCNTREIPSDPVEVSLLYAQAVDTVVNKDHLPVSEKVALQLAGLQCQVGLGEPQPSRLDLYAQVDRFLPARIKQSRFLSDREWVPILAEAHGHYGAGKAEVVAKVWYLSCVMQYPLYGTTLFAASYRGYWSYGNNIVLGVNAEGILLVKPADKSILFQFSYPEIESLLLDPTDDFITLNLAPSRQERQRVYVFQTPHKAVIGALVVSYCPQLADWIREADAPKRKIKQVTNEDRMRLHQNLVNCRRALIDSQQLKKPIDDGTGFFKNTLRRLSTKKMDKLRAEALANEQGEVYKGHSHAFWAFTKTSMSQTLSVMADNDEQQALEVFNLILTYAGLSAANKGSHF